MKKVIIFSLFVASMFVLASCGGPSDDQVKSLDSLNSQLDKALNDLNTTETTPVAETSSEPAKTISSENFKVFNNAKPYFKVADGEYKPYVKDGIIYIQVVFELIKTYEKAVPHEQAFVELVPQNANGGKVKNQSNINFRSDDSDGSSFYNFIKSEPGEKITFDFSATAGEGFSSDPIKAKELLDDLAKFQVKFELN